MEKLSFKIKCFDVVYRKPEHKKQITKFYITLENLNDFGIERFYNDVMKILEIKYFTLCYLKIGTKVLISDKCNFTNGVKGTAIKTKKKTVKIKEFVNKWGYNDTDTKIFAK